MAKDNTKKVSVLGTEYTIILNATEEDYPKLKGLSGYMDPSIKQIVIRKFEKDENSLENLIYCKNETIRHELVHAFLHESGLDSDSEWAKNEEIVDWIAEQFQKMLNVYLELDVVDIPMD